MSESTQRAESFDEILGRFLAELEQGANREHLIHTYALQYPDHAAEFREYAELPELLDQAAGETDEPHPARLGDFRIIREISHGGMKTVYEAMQEPLERRVAVATIRRGRILPAHRERFLREQRVLARLHQTHIVPIFAAGEAGPIQYFAMPYIEGAALHHIIRVAGSAATRSADSKTPSLKALVQHVLQPADDTATTLDAARQQPPQEPRAASGGSGPDSAAKPAAIPPQSPALSREYYRSVAKVMADVAESLQHAHERGFLHRDLKPANIMVGTDERSWLIDFGLAGLLQAPDPPPAETQALEADDPLTSTRGVLGTPGYMAPEQEAGESTDARTDVWGLGATLYELLTLRRALPNQLRGDPATAAAQRHPPAPRSLIGNIPRDLEAICLKSLRAEPGTRYQTAGEVAEDLHRWLRGEPTLAYPARAPRRTYLWARRNKGWASAIAVSLLAFLALTTAMVLVQRARADLAAAGASQQRARADAADAQAKEQRARAEAQLARANVSAAEAKAQRERAEEQERESLMLRVERLLAPGQVSGWSARAWDLERQVVQLRKDDRVRNQASAILGGLDVATTVKLPEFGAQTLLFGPEGQRLLMGTLVPWGERSAAAKLWQVGTKEPQELRGAGFGPVAFDPGGTPLQLTLRREQNELALVDLSQGDVVSRFAIPSTADVQFSGQLAVAPDGSSVAAIAETPDEQPVGVLLRNAAKQDWLPMRPLDGVTALAFSPDGTLLGAGDEDGTVAVWSVRTGQALVSLRATRNEIGCLAFSRDRLRTTGTDDAETNGWLLAAGDRGSTVTIWDLTRKVPRSYCRGNSYDVQAVAFSPDGATLASAGHGETWIWDVATGGLILRPDTNVDGMRSLAFSPDGRRLATGGNPAKPLSVVVCELSPGRGITGLRGLACPISRICFSPDGHYVAGLAHNWELGLWDLRTGFLLHLFETPRGISADNAALAFSPDGRRFAFSAGREAKAWDVVSGREVQRWELYEGLVDCLAYAAPDRLLSLRVETQDGKRGPYSNAPPDQHPRVCRLRQLPEQGPPQELKEIPDFNLHVFCAAVSPVGKYFSIEGLAGTREQRRRLLKIFDAAGAELATLPTSRLEPTAMHVFDPTGNLLGVLTNPGNMEETVLFEMPACREAGRLGTALLCLSPGGTHFGISGTGFSLFRRDQSEPLVVFDANRVMPAVQPRLDAAGTRLAWGRTDGTVVVADLPEVQRRLAELGLGW